MLAPAEPIADPRSQSATIHVLFYFRGYLSECAFVVRAAFVLFWTN